MADRFDDIPDLWAYWSATESTIADTAGAVTAVDSVYGAGGTAQLTNTGNSNLTIEPANTLGAMPAFRSVALSTSSLWHDVALDTTAQGHTIMALYKGDQVPASDTDMMGAGRAAGTACTYARARSDGTWQVLAFNNITSVSQAQQFATYETAAISNGPSSTSGKFYVDGVPDTGNPLASATPVPLTQIVFLNRPYNRAAPRAWGGDMSIMVFYTRQLTDVEVLEVHDLMVHWATNNEAPSSIGPSTTFGPVSTNDDPSVTGWQWEESPNGADWENVGTILTDISGATTTTLTVNSAPIEADQTRVRCKAFSAKEPAPDGVVSHSAILTVQA